MNNSSPEPSIVSSSSGASDSVTEAIQARLALESAVKNGANWFYWIAGLSLVNTVAAMSGSDWRFILGLGITQVVDAVVVQIADSMATVAGLFVDVFIAGLFVVFGVFAGKRRKWAFLTGMALFAGDSLISVLIQDWIGVAFHAFALWSIWNGFRKVDELNHLDQFSPAGPAMT